MPSPGLLPKVQQAPAEGIYTVSAASSCYCSVIISDNFTVQADTDKPNIQISTNLFNSPPAYSRAAIPSSAHTPGRKAQLLSIHPRK